MKKTYIQPTSTSIRLFIEDTLLSTSVVLSNETNDDDATQWSQKRNDNSGGIWQYMDND